MYVQFVQVPGGQPRLAKTRACARRRTTASPSDRYEELKPQGRLMKDGVVVQVIPGFLPVVVCYGEREPWRELSRLPIIN